MVDNFCWCLVVAVDGFPLFLILLFVFGSLLLSIKGSSHVLVHKFQHSNVA